MGAVICHGHQQSTPIRVRKRRDLVGEKRADLAWQPPAEKPSKQQSKYKKSRTGDEGRAGNGDNAVLPGSPGPPRCRIGDQSCCCVTEYRTWDDDCPLCQALREEHVQDEYTQVLNSEMSVMIEAVYGLSSLVEQKLKEKQKTRQDIWKREGTFGIFVTKGEDGRRRIVVRDGWTSYHIDGESAMPDVLAVANAVGGDGKNPTAGSTVHPTVGLPSHPSQQPALSPATTRSHNAQSGGVLVRRVQPRVLTRSHTTTTGTPEAPEGPPTGVGGNAGGAAGRVTAPPPVDTLEACERAARRLREVASHLQHGDVPLAVLQKTLTYAACVLETVCQEETRQGIRKPLPAHVSEQFNDASQMQIGDQTCMAKQQVTTTTSATTTTTMPTTTTTTRAASTLKDASPSGSSSSKLNQFSILSSNITPTSSRRPLTATASTTGGLLAFSSVSTTSSSSSSSTAAAAAATTSQARSSSPSSRIGPYSAASRCRLSAQKSIDVTSIGDSDNSQREQRRAALLSTRAEGSPRSPRNSAAGRQNAEADRKLLDEDDELSEVRPDAVPTEVREWLESTFTRQSASLPKRRSEDKPRFRSVANAIRAGIMVDRLYRRVSPSAAVHLQVPPPIVDLLKTTDEWCFNVFKLNELSTDQALRYLSFDLLNRYGLVHKFKMSSLFLENFLTQIEAGYKKFSNPYHNNMHAADVTQTVHFMLCRAGVANWLTDLEIFATLFAAIIHDYEHTGTTNNFHVMSRSETALIYNDRSVLENHHISSAFRVMQRDDCNVLANLSREEYREFRSLVIEMVLATDMTSHFQQVKTMKTALGHHDFSLDKPKSLCLILHACDISHPAKEWNLHTRWTGFLMEEFFKQGDKEKQLGLPYSPLCDRNTTMVAESQIGFIDFILSPTMDVCSELIMKIYQQVLHQQQQQRASSASTTGTPSEDSSRSSSVSSVGSQDVPKEPARPWMKYLEVNRLRWQERAAQDAEAKRLADEQASVTNNGSAEEATPASAE